MTIAIISSRFPRSGEAFLGPELEGLRAQFDRVIVVPAREALFSRNTLLEALRAVRAHPAKSAAVVKLLFAKRCRPSVFFKNLVLLPKALAVSRTIELEKVDHIHAYWMSAPATVALVASQLTGVPWSSTAHRWDIYERNLLNRKAERATFLRTISERGSQDLSGLIGPTHRPKVRQVRVGVRIPEIGRRNASRVVRMLCAANLIEQKGHRDLLDALAMLAARGVPFRCDIAGSGPLDDVLRRRIEELKLGESVKMCGRVEHARLLESLRQGEYDVAVLASKNSGGGRMEGIPVALIEAMAAGLPCVATDSGSIPELLDESAGYVVPAGDVTQLAAAIERLANSPALRLQLGQNARRRVAEHFNIAQTSPLLAELIRQS